MIFLKSITIERGIENGEREKENKYGRQGWYDFSKEDLHSWTIKENERGRVGVRFTLKGWQSSFEDGIKRVATEKEVNQLVKEAKSETDLVKNLNELKKLTQN